MGEGGAWEAGEDFELGLKSSQYFPYGVLAFVPLRYSRYPHYAEPGRPGAASLPGYYLQGRREWVRGFFLQ